MHERRVRVVAAFDRDAHVWFVKDSDLHGLNVAAPTLEALTDKLPGALIDLLELEGFFSLENPWADVPIEVIG